MDAKDSLMGEGLGERMRKAPPEHPAGDRLRAGMIMDI